MKVFLGHSFSESLPDSYYEKVKKIYQYLYQNHHEIYIGGLPIRLKDVLSDYRSQITCYSIEKYKSEKNYCKECSYNLVENSIRRTEKLITNTDWQLFLPGGTGTLTEILESLEYNRALENHKPILLYDEEHFFDKLIDYLQELILKKYNDKDTNKYICIIHSIEELEEKMKEGI